MNNAQAQQLVNEKILPELHRRFELLFPDIWIKSTTESKEVYESANGCMYRWYMHVISAVSMPNFSPKYSQTYDETINNDWSCVQRFYYDLLKTSATEDFLKFVVENTMIKY